MKVVKLHDLKYDYLDVIENDPDKEYGYSEIYMTENDEEPEMVYACSVYKHRLPFAEKPDYFDAVEDLSQMGDDGYVKTKSFADAIRVHLYYWMQAKMTDDEIYACDVHIGTNEEITALLIKGFEEPRIFVAVSYDEN